MVRFCAGSISSLWVFKFSSNSWLLLTITCMLSFYIITLFYHHVLQINVMIATSYDLVLYSNFTFFQDHFCLRITSLTKDSLLTYPKVKGKRQHGLNIQQFSKRTPRTILKMRTWEPEKWHVPPWNGQWQSILPIRF